MTMLGEQSNCGFEWRSSTRASSVIGEAVNTVSNIGFRKSVTRKCESSTGHSRTSKHNVIVSLLRRSCRIHLCWKIISVIVSLLRRSCRIHLCWKIISVIVSLL